MRKLTRRELTNEGIWSAIGRGAYGTLKGIGGAAIRGVDAALPELTQPWKKAYQGVKDVLVPSYRDMVKIWKGRTQYIIQELEDMGYIVQDANQIKRSGKNYIVPAHKIIDYDPSGKPVLDKKASPFLIDQRGTIIKNLRYAKVSPTLS